MVCSLMSVVVGEGEGGIAVCRRENGKTLKNRGRRGSSLSFVVELSVARMDLDGALRGCPAPLSVLESTFAETGCAGIFIS